MERRDVIADLQSRISSIESGAVSIETAPDSRKRRQSTGSSRCSKEEKSAEDKLGDSQEAFKKIMALVNVSERSERGVRDRLQRDGYLPSAIEESVERAKECGFIDDIRFGEVLIRSRISQGKGSAGIIRELAENEIDVAEVPGWPYEFPVSPEEETNRALEVLGRKPSRAKNKRDAAYRRLMQKGYPSTISSTAARIWAESFE